MKSKIRSIVATTIVLASVFVTTGAVLAEETLLKKFSLTPIPVEVRYNTRYTSVTVDDNGTGGHYQARVYAWSKGQYKGSQLQEAKDVVVFPKVFRAPKKVRIGLPAGNPGDVEKAYRVVVSQIASEGMIKNINGVNFNVVTGQNAPLFVSPKTVQDEIQHTCTTDSIKITNAGNVHQKVIKTDDKTHVVYILPGEEVELKAKSITTAKGKVVECKNEGKI